MSVGELVSLLFKFNQAAVVVVPSELQWSEDLKLDGVREDTWLWLRLTGRN